MGQINTFKYKKSLAIEYKKNILNYKHGKTFISYYDKAMLLLQTDYVVLDIELNERGREMPLNITVQCNGKVKRTTQYISVEKARDGECSGSMVKCENTGKYYDVDIYGHNKIYVLLQTFKDLGYDIPLQYTELQKLITTAYLKNKSFPITE